MRARNAESVHLVSVGLNPGIIGMFGKVFDEPVSDRAVLPENQFNDACLLPRRGSG
jgi:hypothetical protein